MRIKVAFVWAMMLSSAPLYAQEDPWANVKPADLRVVLEPVDLTESQKAAIADLFKRTGQLNVWGCTAEDDGQDLLSGLSAKQIPLSSDHNVLLLEAGPGCARGGQGSNGAMWLIRVDEGRMVFLATPEESFGGWLCSIQRASHFGYRDIIVGWHMSAFETDLTYFRFDGRIYRNIGAAEAVADEHGSRIIPRPLPPNKTSLKH